MSRESQESSQSEINENINQLLASPAWKHFRGEAEIRMQELLQDILAVSSGSFLSQDSKKLYTIRDVQCIKFHLIRNLINMPGELLSIPIKELPQDVSMDDVYLSGLDDSNRSEESDPNDPCRS